MCYKNYNMWGLSMVEPRSANLSFVIQATQTQRRHGLDFTMVPVHTEVLPSRYLHCHEINSL